MYKIKFGTDGWRAIVADGYTYENLQRVSEATAHWVKSKYENPVVVIGYDCRYQGKSFTERAAQVIASSGIKVIVSDSFVSTPMVSLAVVKQKADLGIVITASHNPPEYNGFKLKANFGGASGPEVIHAVEDLIPDSPQLQLRPLQDLQEEGMISYLNFEQIYLDEVFAKFDIEAIKNTGIGVAYDAMYGAGQSVMNKILPETVTLHGTFNPSFNGQAPEPLHKNLSELSELIASKENLHFGMATDGDADRIGLYNHKGEFVDSHKTLLLLTNYLHKYKGLSGKVVTTFSVTNKLNQLCKHFGLPIQTTKIGFKYVCGIMVSENVIVGGEESGGLAIAGHIPERDGIWIALTILEFMAKTGKSLEDLVNEIYALVGEFYFKRNDLHITHELKQIIMKKCSEGAFKNFGDLEVTSEESIDGYKYFFSDNEWVLIRPSGTEPVLRVYCEAPTMKRVEEILAKVEASII